MHIHFIIHEAFESAVAYETWALNQGHQVSYSRVYLNETLPNDPHEFDWLIVMGGPQSPATKKAECAYFDSEAEQAIILSAIKANKAVIGVCLGSQLIGEALGANFAHSPEREIGKFLITLTSTGKSHPLFSHFGSQLEVGHWHNDMPGLTDSAKIIAYSEGCPRQIIEYGEFIYGFQCHMEFNREVVELLIENSVEEMKAANEYRFVDSSEILRSHDYDDMNKKLYLFLNKLQHEFLFRKIIL